MSKVKEKSCEVKQINSKRSKKCSATKATKTNGVIKDIQDAVNGNQLDKKQLCALKALEQKVNEDDSSFKSCEEKVLRKLKSVLNGFTGQSFACHLDGDQIRKQIQEEKCVTKDSMQDIKLFFTDVLSLNDDVSCNTYCVLASKYLRIFIDILEVTENDQLEFVIQACDLVITVHQYFFMMEKLPAMEKFIAMLHHVIKQLYKKQHIDGIVVIIKNVMNFLEVAVKKNTVFPEDSKRSLCMIHQMCYSLYYKELQKLIEFEKKKSDITSFFDLRVSSLIILSFSSWSENKFIDHLTNFISNESIILVQSCTYNKEIISNSIFALLNTLYKLIELESNEINQSAKSLLDVTWKLAHLYVNFCLRNRLENELCELFALKPEKVMKSFSCFSEGMTVLQKSSDLSKLVNQCHCVCSSQGVQEALQYPLLVNNYFNMYFNSNIPDVSQLFDILSLIKVNFKYITQLCGSVVNVLLEVILFVTRILLKTSASEQKNKTLSLLSYVRGLLVQIKSHLFSDSENTLKCYTRNKELRCNFDVLYNDYVIVLQSFLYKQKNNINQEDLKWLVVLCKIGIHYYNLKQYSLALPSLQFSIFLYDLWNEKNLLDVTCLKDLMQKYNTLAECYSKLGNLKECYHIYLKSIKHFEKLSCEELSANKSLLETQVTYWAKKKLQFASEDSHSSTFLERCLLDEISCKDENNAFLSLALEYEYYAYKKLSSNFDVQSLMKRLFALRKDLFEQEGEMLKYALCMIEMSTSSCFDREERLHWCSEAIGLVEEFYENLDDTGDEFEWHVRDVLAVSFFQRSVIQYEERVIESIENIEREVSELIVECTDITTDGKKESYDNCLLEEDYIDKQFITSLNAAMQLWTEIAERALEGEPEKGDSSVFYDAEGSAKCLYHAAVFYSLLSQNLNSVKASYLSGLIYQMLSFSNDGNEYKEKQVVSWALTASQFLLIKNVSSGEKILQKLQDTRNCSVFSNLHIGVLKAAYLLYSGNIQLSAESFHHILNNEVLNDNTKSSLIIKSDIYFLLSYLKLIPLREEKGEIIIPHDQHFPSKSPFPPISDCLRYLRSLYSKYVEEPGTQGVEITLSSNWAYLDKLLICLTRNAELLKHQGSILEAKSLLKEALLLTRKYHLSLRTVDILQQLASMDIILNNQNSFNETFGTVTKILEPTVHDCFCESQLLVPDFVTHDSQCECNYCIYPKLQEIHVFLYLQYIESKQQFCQLSSDEYDTSIEVIDTLVENAYQRYIASLREVYRIMDMCLQPSSEIEEPSKEVCQQTLKRGKIPVCKKKTKLEYSKTKNNNEDKELFNIFLRYSHEVKINQSITENQSMIRTVEQLILKAELSDSFEQTHHEYHRLSAQLYRLRSLLYLGEDIAEKVWFCQSDESKGMLLKNLNTPIISSNVVTNKRDKKKAPLTTKTDCNLITDETPRPVRKIKQKTRRKGKLNVVVDETPKGNSKSNKKQITKYSNELSIIKCLEDLQKSLAVLNPYTDVLIIKAIYQLLILLSGTSNKDLTIACQLLSASRTLHQQMLSSYGKKLRDRKSLKSPLESKEQEVLETTSNLLERYSDPKLVFDYGSMQHLVKDYIPQDWCVCSLSLAELENKRYLILCRLQGLKEPAVMKINLSDKPRRSGKEHVVCDLAAAFDSVDLLEKFNSLIEESQESMKITEKKLWWAERVRLDKELKSSISRLEDEWLQGWKGMLLGQYEENEMEFNRNFVADEIAENISSSINKNVEKVLIECLVDGFEYCTKYQIIDSLQTLFGEKDTEIVYEIFVQCLEKNKYGVLREDTTEEGNTCSSTRKPVVLILDKTLQKLPWESMCIFQDQPVTRMPSFLMISSHCKNYQDGITEGVTLEKCCYVLNPKDDLKRTEEKFADWFQSEGWHGIVGRPPTQAEYSDAITENDLFIYCGHGSGQEYLGWSAVNRLQSSAVSLLMGCSSGKLLVQGELEAQGMVLYYLSAGCPAVVANLWHVTDKDIDLFLEELLKLWLTEERGRNLAECVAKARHACKLEYLNGAAPVVYGLPLFVKDV